MHCRPPQINEKCFFDLDVLGFEIPTYGTVGRHATNSATPHPNYDVLKTIPLNCQNNSQFKKQNREAQI